LWRRRKHIVLIRRHCVWKLYTEINDLRNKMLPTYISIVVTRKGCLITICKITLLDWGI